MVREDQTQGVEAVNARTILIYFESFEFVFMTHLLMEVLGCTFTLSRSLQRRDWFIVNGIHLINVTKECLDKVRVDHGKHYLKMSLVFVRSMTSKSLVWMIFTSQF